MNTQDPNIIQLMDQLQRQTELVREAEEKRQRMEREYATALNALQHRQWIERNKGISRAFIAKEVQP